MGCKFTLGVVVLALSLVALGCGGGKTEALKNAPRAAPTDLGSPDAVATGVTEYPPSHFIVKEVVDGETRIWVVSNRVRGPEPSPLTWDAQAKIFTDAGRAHRYASSGQAQHKVAKGANAGQPGMSLLRYKIELDANGRVLFYPYRPIEKDQWEDPGEGAYVVVP